MYGFGILYWEKIKKGVFNKMNHPTLVCTIISRISIKTFSFLSGVKITESRNLFRVERLFYFRRARIFIVD